MEEKGTCAPAREFIVFRLWISASMRLERRTIGFDRSALLRECLYLVRRRFVNAKCEQLCCFRSLYAFVGLERRANAFFLQRFNERFADFHTARKHS